jgi:hypothetical protein
VTDPIVRVRNLVKDFVIGRGSGGQAHVLRAVNQVSFDIAKGENPCECRSTTSQSPRWSIGCIPIDELIRHASRSLDAVAGVSPRFMRLHRSIVLGQP